ncbi:MAG TPA: serine/threonine-protein kinase [Vicinamibacterales bacterium]|nr:serine/threonine-protein kinase [Vicinamibacterales bacterium]
MTAVFERDGSPVLSWRQALVMELVEGETLASRIARGPVPVADAVNLAAQIADAIDAAHGKGIVHRDLKPANISISADGTVKVLDFGLAKTIVSSPVAEASDSDTTVLDGRTQAGTVMGTTAYMSPEQARGEPVDGRTDIWAFGCVVYEMLVRDEHAAAADERVAHTRRPQLEATKGVAAQ